jgi:hypothetical protein
MNKYTKLLIAVAYLLIVIIVSYQVFSQPLFGIANNGDFQRFSLKFGVDYRENPWTDENYNKYFWSYVTDDYKIVEPMETGFSSTHELLGTVSVSLANVLDGGGNYSIRYMGIVNTVFYLFGVALLFITLKDKKFKEVVILCILGVVFFTDKEIVQFFNSFYTESGSIIYFLFYIGLNLLYSKIPNSDRKYKVFILILEAFIIFMFLNAKLQNILGIIPMVILFGIKIVIELKENFKTKVCIVSLSIFLSFLFILVPTFLSFSKNTESSKNLVSYNVMMMEMLDLSAKPREHLLEMGVAEEDIVELEQGIGQNAYSNRELFEKYSLFFDRKQQVKIFMREPILIFKLFSEQSENLFIIIDYGNFPGDVDEDTKVVSTQFSNIKIIRESLYIKNLYFLIFVLLIFIIVVLRKFRKRMKEESAFENLLLLSFPIYIILFFLTTVLGDSGHEIVKHMYLLNLIFDIIIFYLFYQLIIFIPKLWRNIK